MSEIHRHKFHYGDEESESVVTVALDNCVWRLAKQLDGKAYWINSDGSFGEPVSNGKFKVQHFGEYMGLALIDDEPDGEDDSTKIQKQNDDRVGAFLDSVAARLMAYHAGEELEEQHDAGARALTEPIMKDLIDKVVQTIVKIMAESHGRNVVEKSVYDNLSKEYIKGAMYSELKTFAQDLIVDGVLLRDINGRLDLDFDNEGPELSSENQMMSGGLLKYKSEDDEAIRERNQALRRMFGNPDDDAGYESESSVISQDHCHTSPHYPQCGDDCWLRNIAEATPSSNEEEKEVIFLPTGLPNVYEPLESGHIRLLVLEPGPADDMIVCRLEHRNISIFPGDEATPAEPEFEALSYTWGNPAPTHFITCNGQDFPVATNLFHALQYLRLNDQPRSIWIDAISINQGDIPERNEQVSRMHAIYQAASAVVVWLGPHSDDSELAMRSINYLQKVENRHELFRHDHGESCVQNLKRVATSLQNILGRPWFERSWIRQEISAAKRITIKCGDGDSSWSALKKSSSCLWRLLEKINSNRFDDGPEVETTSARDLPFHFLKRRVLKGQSLFAENADIRSLWYYHAGGLLEYLMVSRCFKATDPRDKVYAVLGMTDTPIENPNEPGKENELTMRIDYAAPVTEVYQYVAKYLINRDKNLDILCILSTHRDTNSSDLPTWVPDWRVPASTIPIREHWDYYVHKKAAAGFTTTIPQDQERLDYLSVQGFELCNIQELMPFGVETLPHIPDVPAGTMADFDPTQHHRRIATTDREPATVPSSAIVGDKIWILFGCKMPIVLRHVEWSESSGEQTFEVVGPCVVGTAMLGKALVEFKESAGKPDNILLV